MKWKVTVRGDKPSEKSARVLTECTGLHLDEILKALSHENEIECNGLAEGEAQKIADSLRRDPGIQCRILPDHEEEAQPVPLFRVLLINYRPGYRTRLRRRLQELTRLPQEQIVQWLSRMPIALSRGINSETAKRIKRSIIESGGIVRIEAESMQQESVSSRRRSNAVFRTPGTRGTPGTPGTPGTREVKVDSDTDSSDLLFGVQNGTTDDDVSLIPPVIDLPEEYSIGPPPTDEFETSSGRVFLQPPARFSVGLPSKSLDGGFLETPPVLPDVSNRTIPQTVEFSPPEVVLGDSPPVVGSDSIISGPPPDMVIPYPPPGSIFQHLLLPPVLEESGEDPLSSEDDSEDDEKKTENDLESGESDEDAVLRLFLCTPAPKDEGRIAEALREVLGVSLRESRALLKKTPALLETCADHKRAIKIAHELNSLGVTVSITRGDLAEGLPSVNSRSGFQAWLSKNG
ncbi:MAG: hypothetical protein KAR44_12320 [Candidatus Aegiribacteria sp.]|nr:hypothetical protein [Candidatus Aegiribacteria sp.]